MASGPASEIISSEPIGVFSIADPFRGPLSPEIPQLYLRLPRARACPKGGAVCLFTLGRTGSHWVGASASLPPTKDPQGWSCVLPPPFQLGTTTVPKVYRCPVTHYQQDDTRKEKSPQGLGLGSLHYLFHQFLLS